LLAGGGPEKFQETVLPGGVTTSRATPEGVTESVSASSTDPAEELAPRELALALLPGVISWSMAVHTPEGEVTVMIRVGGRLVRPPVFSGWKTYAKVPGPAVKAPDPPEKPANVSLPRLLTRDEDGADEAASEPTR
jgi:hypothetical protein